MTDRTIVLLHGAGTGSWVWERVRAALGGRTIALDVPGRLPGATPESCASLLHDAIDAAGADGVVLVMHSLSGVLAPGLGARLGARLKRCIYVSAVVPPAGGAFVDALGFPQGLILRALFLFKRAGLKPSEAMVRRELCNDLDDRDAANVVARYEPEFPGLYVTTVGGPPSVPSTYVRLARDASVSPALQDSMIARLISPSVVDLDAGHLAMLSKPVELATILGATTITTFSE